MKVEISNGVFAGPKLINICRRLLEKADRLPYDADEETRDVCRKAIHVVAMAEDPKYRAWFLGMEREGESGVARSRLLEIWGAILEHDRIRRLPHDLKIKALPRVRGCGAAARKAGFAG